jgi:hypothetical protein
MRLDSVLAAVRDMPTGAKLTALSSPVFFEACRSAGADPVVIRSTYAEAAALRAVLGNYRKGA